MGLPTGKVEYALGTGQVTGCGLSFGAEELDGALAGPVASLVFDDAGKADVAAILESAADTEFGDAAVRRILEDADTVEDWRVGEALAESYITQHRGCCFPWPDSRDERKAGSSLPGADLAGLHQDGDAHRFAFGEVKTSNEGTYPPGTMHGRTGLKQQLEDLRDQVSIRDGLVLYLGYRAKNAEWLDRYRTAAQRYLADRNDVRVFGLLVRDVPPHEDDLRARVAKLGRGCPESMAINLVAMYLPQGSIATLGQRVVGMRNGGGA
ncbi:MAG TPA: hypothetical protein PLJ31_12540 [Armatimonadota bacterium]|nr:hypothetical protein [Armatimonadota bacterium]